MSKKRLTKFEMECMEREARGRAAWGAYGAYRRQANLNEECADLRYRLSSEHLSDREMERRIKEYQDSRCHGMLYVG